MDWLLSIRLFMFTESNQDSIYLLIWLDNLKLWTLHHRWHWITGIYEKLKENIFNLTTSIDGVAPLGAKTSGGAVMTKFMYRRI